MAQTQRYTAASATRYTGSTPGKSSSSTALWLGVVAPALSAAGAFLANRGFSSPFGGFLLFGAAIPLSLLALIFGLFALVRARGGRNRAAAVRAGIGMGLAALTLAGVAGLAAPSANYPRINDITTDTDDPPVFVANVKLQSSPGKSMDYRPEFAEIQKKAYPTLQSRVVAMPPEEAFARMREALENLRNVRVTYASVKEGRLEAVAVSRLFRFVDDVVIRIRPVPEGSRIDVRSRSRVGKGDMGVNAQRIESILSTLR